MKVLAQGAEATISLDTDIVKERTVKSYRHPEIDLQLRKSRTRREAKVLQKLESLSFPSPRLIHSDNTAVLRMEFLDGPKLRDVLSVENAAEKGLELGKKIRILHDAEIIHGDLTTSNMIQLEEIFFIDFGLSFFSQKVEDKAVDIHLLRQALESKHYVFWEEMFAKVLEGYNDEAVIKRFQVVEQRGRNKAKY